MVQEGVAAHCEPDAEDTEDAVKVYAADESEARAVARLYDDGVIDYDNVPYDGRVVVAVSGDCILDSADRQGSVTLSPGVYLCSQEHMIAESAAWDDDDDDDEGTRIDLSTAPYWLVTNDGVIKAVHELADIE